MDKNITPEQRKDRVEEIMEELNLKKCENTLIGVAAKNIKGISGGEKRRLAFGCEVNAAIYFIIPSTTVIIKIFFFS